MAKITYMDNERVTGESERSQLLYHTIRWLIAGIIIFVGIVGGIYAGMALSGRSTRGPSAETLRNGTYLELGDKFPDYPVRSLPEGTHTTLQGLVSGRRTLLIFTNFGCEACEAMTKYWSRKEFGKLNPDIQIILVYSLEEEEQVRDKEILPGAKRVITDRSAQRNSDGITATPTIVALDNAGNIVSILTGFDRGASGSFFNKLLR